MNALILGSKEYPLGTNTDDPSPSGGMELYVEDLIENLSKYSNITIITRNFSKTKKHERKGNVEIHRVPWLNGFFLRNPSFNLISFLKSLRIKYDVIISNGEVANLFGLIAAKLKRRPIIMVNHGLAAEQDQYNKILKFGFSLIDKITYSRSDYVITHSPSKLPKGVDYKVIVPGFNKNKFKKDISLKTIYKPKGLVIVFTGRLMKVKGLRYLIEALSELKREYTCFIVGDGPERKELEDLSKRLKTNTIFTGFRKDINKFLSIADVFVLPSISESLNYSMVEAAYMNVPIISTDLGVIPKDAYNQIKKRDSKSIRNSLERFKPDKKRMRNAYEFTKKFDWSHTAKAYSLIIKSLVKEKI